MRGNQPKPGLTLVNLIHQALRADARRLAAAVAALDPGDRARRLPGIRAFFDQYRAQLVTHHAHEDELFFPALRARVGADTTPRPQAQFLIPWVITHSTTDQKKALYRSVPPARLPYWLNRRRYRHLDQALTHTARQPAAPPS